jgi:hypothetical protein
MGVAALITWVVTALGGFVLLWTWLSRGGLRDRAASASKFPPALILGHFLLAAGGLVLWIVYLATDSDALAWVAFAALLVVALMGFTMLAFWLQGRRVPATAGAAEAGGATTRARPPEQHFPVPVVVLHGLLAATTLVLVLLTAVGAGD